MEERLSNRPVQFLSVAHLKTKSKLVDVDADGNCLFRALAHFPYSGLDQDVEPHVAVRQAIVLYLRDNAAQLSQDEAVFTPLRTMVLTGKNRADSTFAAYCDYLEVGGNRGDIGAIFAFGKLAKRSYVVWRQTVDQHHVDEIEAVGYGGLNSNMVECSFHLFYHDEHIDVILCFLTCGSGEIKWRR